MLLTVFHFTRIAKVAFICTALNGKELMQKLSLSGKDTKQLV